MGRTVEERLDLLEAFTTRPCSKCNQPVSLSRGKGLKGIPQIWLCSDCFFDYEVLEDKAETEKNIILGKWFRNEQ